jgi:uncharacterized protein
LKPLRKQSTWILLVLFLLPVLASGIRYGRQIRQQHLDHALIVAIKKKDTSSAISLLNQGADANATDKPYTLVTLQSFLAEFWNRIQGKKPPKDIKFYPPALLLPYWEEDIYVNFDYTRNPIIKDEAWENAQMVSALLEHGADPYAMDSRKTTLLHYATYMDHTDTIKVLLEHHFNPNIQNIDGVTPLIWAGDNAARILIEHGADIHLRDRHRRTAFMCHNSLETLQLLIDHKSDINAQDDLGQTALHLTVHPYRESPSTSHDTTTVSFLLQHGAKVFIKDVDGLTALDYAKSTQDQDLIPLLEQFLKKEQAERQPTSKTTTK